MTESPDERAALLARTMRLLGQAGGRIEGRSGFHDCFVATAGPDRAPSVRTVVLRGVSEEGWRIWFHSDLRSEKIDHIRGNPSVSVLFWDDDAKLQLRARGTATIVGPQTQDARDAWSNMHGGQRSQYRTSPAPGTAIDGPTAYDDGRVGDETDQPVSDHFCIVRIEIAEMTVLDLSGTTQVRARYRRDDEGKIEGVWIAP